MHVRQWMKSEGRDCEELSKEDSGMNDVIYITRNGRKLYAIRYHQCLDHALLIARLPLSVSCRPGILTTSVSEAG